MQFVPGSFDTEHVKQWVGTCINCFPNNAGHGLFTSPSALLTLRSVKTLRCLQEELLLKPFILRMPTLHLLSLLVDLTLPSIFMGHRGNYLPPFCLLPMPFIFWCFQQNTFVLIFIWNLHLVHWKSFIIFGFCSATLCCMLQLGLVTKVSVSLDGSISRVPTAFVSVTLWPLES